MRDTRWTDEQWEAIIEKDCNLLVAAAAGAGKTAVLVERIIRKITDEKQPVDIDRLLIVTFTNAAAAEMRERIAEAISAVLESNPGSKNIQRQLTLLQKASITTIHSFCLEVIRSHFHSIHIDPGFRIADETESMLLKMEALNELFEDQYEKEDANEGYFELLECYGGNRDDQVLQNMVLDIYGFIQSSPWPQAWLEEMTESFNPPEALDLADTPWGRVLLNAVILELEGLKEMLGKAVEVLQYAVGLEKYTAVFNEDLAKIEALLKTCRDPGEALWDRLYHAFQSFVFSRLPNAAKDCDKEKQESVKKIRDTVKTRIKRITERFFSVDSADTLNDLNALYPMMKCLSGLVSEFSERYAVKKSSKSVVDFNDLEHFCLQILSEQGEEGQLIPSKAAMGYRDRFAEILVDEYQDSNLVQEIIVRMISKEDAGQPNVFMVGDVKQSIYRFRQAKPELFLDKYNRYSMEKGELFRKILLFKNFRSRKEVVDAVNFIFKQIMSERAGELDYTDREALNPGANFAANEVASVVVGGASELLLIQTGGSEGAPSGVEEEREEEADGESMSASEEDISEDEEMLGAIQCEARLIAGRIRKLLMADEEGREYHVYDKNEKSYRKVEYRDIVILLRTTRNWAEIFMEELSGQGIPAFADTGNGFFKTSEIQVILSLLQIIDNPLQDIPLLAVLRSPIVSLSSDELAELRLVDRKASFFDALCKLAEAGDRPTSRKAAAFLRQLDRWRDMSLYMSTDRLLWHLYNDTGYYGIVGAMPAGEQRQANLRILFERARQFEETSYKGLFNFINFIDKLKGNRGDMGSAKILGENDNVVRIMSIHKSKGLEFPVVILAGCGKKFNLQDMNKSILLHQELGFGPDVVDHRKRLSYPSVPKLAIREKIKTETLSEEMRILYVALTRAREKLIISGTVTDVAKAAAGWAQCAAVPEYKLPAYDMLRGTRYLDWIAPALLRHKDCGKLREYAGVTESFRAFLMDDPSSWSIEIWNKSEVSGSSADQVQDADMFARWLEELETAAENGEVLDHEDIARRLKWNYTYLKSSKVPAKVSVTELKRRFDMELSEEVGAFPEYLPVMVKKPAFLEEKKGLSAAEAGTVLHFVMQHLDYRREDIEGQIEEMVAKALLTEQQAKCVDVGKIQRFLASPLGQRMLASDRISREVPFNMEIPCHELYKDMEDEACGGETLLLQGVIDCFFEEPGGIVLLDYKTDYAPVDKVDTLRERYRYQIGCYARALEMLTGKKVKHKYIYLFWSGEVLEYA